MNNILKTIVIASMTAVTLTSCETYKVGDPDMTAISNIDGKYAAFAYENNESEASTVLGVVITNTAYNESDKAWITITDLNPMATPLKSANYLDAVRFKVDVDIDAQTFSCTEVSATEPITTWNPYREGGGSGEGGFYTAAYKLNKYSTYTISCTGRIVTGGTAGTNNNRIDTIEIDSYSRTYPDGTVKKYVVKGQKYTGWADEMKEYNDFIKAGRFK